MVFNSYTFIVFFLIVLFLHNMPFSWKVRKIILLLASYVFYAAWNPPFILLLWLSTVVDYFVGKALYTQENKHKKRVLLVISLIGNLGAALQTIVGGNITILTNLCEKTREDAFELLLQHAGEHGANAVIGMRYDATEVMQGVTEVLAYGTAVQVERNS